MNVALVHFFFAIAIGFVSGSAAWYIAWKYLGIRNNSILTVVTVIVALVSFCAAFAFLGHFHPDVERRRKFSYTM